MKKYFVILALTLPLVAFAQTGSSTADLQDIIKQLRAQIQLLQTQIADLQTQIQSVKAELKFSRVLIQGATGDDVKQLQEFLKTFPNVYPEGLVTGYFGPLTQAAVKKFQEQNGIESVGIVGPKTQAKLTELTTTGAGQSGVVPPGLLIPPEIQKKIETTTPSATSTPPSAISTTTIITATTSTNSLASTTSLIATTTQPTPPAPFTNNTPPPPPPTTTSTDTTAPSIPTNLSAVASSPSRIDLSWTASTDNVAVIGYKIYHSGTQISTTIASATSTTMYYIDTGLQASTAYTYTVAAYDASENTSAQSVSTSATTNPPPAPVSTLPDAPIITSITPATLNEHFISSVTLQWNAVTNPVSSSYLISYKVYRSFGGGDWLLSGDTQQTTFFDLNIGRGNYSYYINACNTNGCGSSSNTMTATLAGGGGGSDTAPPGTPTDLAISVVNSDSPYISWTASTDNVGVVGYNIYRNGTYLKSVSGSPAIDDSVSRSTTSSYAVTAYDAAGNESSQTSPMSLSIMSPPSLNNMTSSLANVSESLKSLTIILKKIQRIFP